MLEAGFGRTDITPRVGVELCGYGPYRNRHSTSVRDRLWAKAIALKLSGTTLVLVSCDLIGVATEVTRRVRELVRRSSGLPPEAVMVHCTHTHSGPNPLPHLTGWGDVDAPWYEMLPYRIAKACEQAIGDLQPATLRHAATPCEGIALNRQYDRDSPPFAEVADENWRPAKPELTDTRCHVLTVNRGDKLAGFLAYFGCHPVVGSSVTTCIHGDFVGVAMTMLEREASGSPGITGMFLQGALGDVNSGFVHKNEAETMMGLDILASRFARSVRRGVAEAQPIEVDVIRGVLRDAVFKTRRMTEPQLRKMLAEYELKLHTPEASDEDGQTRLAMVYVSALRDLIARRKRGDSMDLSAQVQGFRIGPVSLLGAPLEIFQAIKNDVVKQAVSPVPLVLSVTNDELGYATDRTTAATGGYAAEQVPFMCRQLPFDKVHDSLAGQLLDLDASLHEGAAVTRKSKRMLKRSGRRLAK